MTSKAALMWENRATTKRPQKVLPTPPGPRRSQPKEADRLMAHVATPSVLPVITQVGGS